MGVCSHKYPVCSHFRVGGRDALDVQDFCNPSQCHVSIINRCALAVGDTILDVGLVWSLHSVAVNDMETLNKRTRTSHSTSTHHITHYQ